MRNTLLIIRREYLERVRSKSFLLSTIGLPLMLGALMIFPEKLQTMKTSTVHHLAVAASPKVAESLKQQLEAGEQQGSARGESVRFKVVTAELPTETARQNLAARVERGEIEAFLWVPDDALASGKVSISGRDLSDFMEIGSVKSAVARVRQRQMLAAHGVAPEDVDSALEPVSVDTIRIERGKATKTSTQAGVLASLVMVMMLYVTLLVHGVSVMRSVLEEKTSRVMEVLLASVTAREMMVGKILGVGAVGLTQVLVWIGTLGITTLPGAAASGFFQEARITPASLAAFAAFFVLGYLLYSTLFATIGAIIGSEQDGHQVQIVAMSPLIASVVFMTMVMREPNSAASVWLSMVPFFAPILMYLRIAVQPPAMWQIAVSIVLLIVSIWVLMQLCGRIYRVGVLMYGKRPTLPELLKWLKYARS